MVNRELDAYLGGHLFGLRVREVATTVYLGYGNIGEEKVLVVENGPVYEDLPDYSTTGNGMLMVIDAMKAKGWKIALHERRDGEYEFGFSKYDVYNYKGLIERTRQAPHLPTAVAEAAKAALEGEKQK